MSSSSSLPFYSSLASSPRRLLPQSPSSLPNKSSKGPDPPPLVLPDPHIQSISALPSTHTPSGAITLPSFVSQHSSFKEHIPSRSSIQEHIPHDLTATGNTLLPPSTLRKSVSVDSFVKHDVYPTSASCPSTSTSRPPAASVSSVQRGEREVAIPYISLRSHGESLSDTKQLYDYPESDVERSDALIYPPDRHRYPSARPVDHIKPSIRGGELPLPARVQPPIVASGSQIMLEDTSVNGTGILQHGTTASFPAPPNRSRSGSLGTHSVASARWATTNGPSPYVSNVYMLGYISR